MKLELRVGSTKIRTLVLPITDGNREEFVKFIDRISVTGVREVPRSIMSCSQSKVDDY